MIRIRWFDPEAEDPVAPVDWRQPSLISAVLFLNFGFWEIGRPRWISGVDLICYSIAAAVILTTLFFLVPALSAQRAQRTLFEVAAESFGRVPGFGFRGLCALYLVGWMAVCLSAIFRIGVGIGFRLEPNKFQSGVGGGSLLVLLFATALPSLKINAKLAAFTAKLAVAMLVAVLIRVRAGIPIAWRAGSFPNVIDGLQDLAKLSLYAAPLLLIASAFGRRCQTRRQVVLLGACGFLLPITLSVVGSSLAIGAAYALHENRSSVPLNIAAVLSYGHSMRFWPKKFALLAITMFGLIRFGAWALAETVPNFRGRRVVRGFSIVLVSVMSALDCCDLAALEPLVRAFTAVAGVLTADALARNWRRRVARFVDLVGLTSVAFGWTVSLWLPYLFWWFPDPWQYPWLLPAYAVSFFACLLGRALEYRRVATPRPAPV